MRSTGIGASGAGDSAWSRYRVLAARDRRERVLVRAVLACAAGVVAAGIGVWWAGIAVAVAAFAGLAAYERARPGVVTDWRRGALAERRTGRRLARLDPAAFHVLHDRALPGDLAPDRPDRPDRPDGQGRHAAGEPATNLDHLVIGLTGVYAIASRRWRRGVRLRSGQGRLWVGSRPAGNAHGAASRAAGTVGDLLSGELDYTLQVEAVVAVHGARVPRDGLVHGGVELRAARTLPGAIARRPVIFTSAQVATIAAAAERALPPMLPDVHADADADADAHAHVDADAE
ncbi:nuclease-related domain-containing protein [Actinomadura sp. 9N407]|uniref:nuclease-related domain-containing protein n=1 Tax=Actinomadura sp. 9N407 TaxID=3375154 RepID=UPI0037B23CCD